MPSIPSRTFMRHLFLCVVVTMLGLCCNTYAEGTGQSPNLLTQVQTIPLDGVEGRIDHFGLDAKRKRLFVSALGNDTVEMAIWRRARSCSTSGTCVRHRESASPLNPTGWLWPTTKTARA